MSAPRLRPGDRIVWLKKAIPREGVLLAEEPIGAQPGYAIRLDDAALLSHLRFWVPADEVTREGAEPPGDPTKTMAYAAEVLRAAKEELELLTKERDDARGGACRGAHCLHMWGLDDVGVWHQPCRVAVERFSLTLDEVETLRTQVAAQAADLGNLHANCEHMIEAAGLAAQVIDLQEKLDAALAGGQITTAVAPERAIVDWRCSTCNGSGIVAGVGEYTSETCPTCKGSG